MKNRISIFMISIILVQIAGSVVASTPASIVIDSHPVSVDADQAVRFDAVVKDSSGNPINEQINWSASDGSIDSTGLFVPGKAGITTITASSGNINSTTTINVDPGMPVGIDTFIDSTEISVDDVVNLNGTLVDRANNHVEGDLVWRCQNGHIDYDNGTWEPDRIGVAVMRVIYLELETRITFNVSAGSPTEIVVPYGLTVQSGNVLHIMPTAVDAYGNHVEIERAGELTWSVENGSISQSGVYFGGTPGIWNVSVSSSSGANGSGIIRVLPAQATGLSIGINTTEARTGSPVIISAIRTDILGNSGPVNLPLANWSVPTGSLSVQGSDVIWIPSRVGLWTLGVSDEGFSATLEVDVSYGIITGIDILLSENILRSGDSIVASISAYDAAGNDRSVDGAWTIDDNLIFEEKEDWILLRPGEIGNYSLSAAWFDNETQITHSINKTLTINPGELARIILPESGTQIPSDGVLNLQPKFEDEYGNLLGSVPVTWVIDGVDLTMEIRLAGDNWAPTSLGMHEVRATAQGVFAITDVEVVAGTARHLTINLENPMSVKSGEQVEFAVTSFDVHGNDALANDVEFEFGDPLGIISPSSQGDGYWIVEGGKTGEWNLRMSTGFAVYDTVVIVTDGNPVRLLAEIPEDTPREGENMILRVYAIDQAGNIVDVEPSEVDIRCSAGSASHIAEDTYQVSIDQSGQSESCTVKWEGLIAQKFFDVDAVLFGGGLGDSNTALTLVSIIIFLFIAIMVVLIRRIRFDDSEDYWDDDYDEDLDDEDDFEMGLENTDVTIDENRAEEEIKQEVKEESEQETEKESTEDLRSRLAAEASRTGVMQAAPGTEQGKTGWYIDSNGELTSWLVGEDGSWTRVS